MNFPGPINNNHGPTPGDPTPVGAPSVHSLSRFEIVLMIALMALVTALAFPSLQFSSASQMASPSRQLLDDLVNARLRAITHRGEVYVVFATNEGNRLTGRAASPNPKLYSINQGPKLPKKPSAPVQTPTMSEWK